MPTRPMARADVIIAIVLALATTLVLLPYRDLHLPTVRSNQIASGDEMGFLATALRVRRGGVLYRDVFDYKGPLGLWPVLVAYTIGPETVKTGRVALMAVVGIWTGLLYLLGLSLIGRRTFALPFALVAPFVIWPGWPYAYPDFTAQLWVTAAVLAAVRASAGFARGWALAGLCAAAALWVHVGEGLPFFVALLLGAAIAWLLCGRREHAARACRGIAAGFAAGVAAVVAWMVAHGVATTAIRNIALFPAHSYRASTYNRTSYGVDADSFHPAWRSVGRLPEAIVKAIVSIDVWLPRFGVATAAATMTALVLLTMRLRRQGRLAPAPAVAAAALAAAAGAVCLPAALNVTRTDLCHLAFVAGGGLIAGAAPLVLARAAWGSTRAWRWMIALVSVALGALVLATGGLYAYSATRRYAPGDVDEYGKALLSTDLAAARTKPTDGIFMATFGGWHYVYTGRDNPTPFFWLYEDPWSADHWPVAAAAIRAKKPRLLLMPTRFFARLASHEPELRSLYFGAENNFMLDDRRPGPALATTDAWLVTAPGPRPEAGAAGPVKWRFVEHGLTSARLDVEVTRAGRTETLLGSIDGDIVCVFDGPITYVGTLAGDGQHIRGDRFEHQRPALPFTASAAHE